MLDVNLPCDWILKNQSYYYNSVFMVFPPHTPLTPLHLPSHLPLTIQAQTWCTAEKLSETV